MDYKEILPIRALHKFDTICLHDKYLHQNIAFQQQILRWAADMLTEAREDWGKIHATTIDKVVKEDRKMQAKKRGRQETISMHRSENISNKSKKKNLMKL